MFKKLLKKYGLVAPKKNEAITETLVNSLLAEIEKDGKADAGEIVNLKNDVASLEGDKTDLLNKIGELESSSTGLSDRSDEISELEKLVADEKAENQKLSSIIVELESKIEIVGVVESDGDDFQEREDFIKNAVKKGLSKNVADQFLDGVHSNMSLENVKIVVMEQFRLNKHN
jgi:putative NIF3 family GTP cyclohydrolase 1 type 2